MKNIDPLTIQQIILGIIIVLVLTLTALGHPLAAAVAIGLSFVAILLFDYFHNGGGKGPIGWA